MFENSGYSSQPQGSVQINWGNPVSRGLSLLTMPGSRFQNIIGSVGFGGDRPSVVVGNGGIGAVAPSGTTYPTVTLPTSLGQAYTVFAFGNITTVGTQGSPIDDDDGSTRGFLFRINATGGPDFIPFTSGNIPAVVSGADFSAAQLAAGVSIAGTVDAAGNVAVWGNGTKTTGSLGGSPRPPSTTLALLNRKVGGTQIPTTRPVYLCAAWSRVLSDAEIASISANPWQLFQRRNATPIFTPTGDSGVLIPDLSSPGVIDVTSNSAKPELNVQY